MVPDTRVRTPSEKTRPGGPLTSARNSSESAYPFNRSSPPNTPRCGTPGYDRWMPAKFSESSTKSAHTPTVSVLLSRRTEPKATLSGRPPSRCRITPVKVTSRHGPFNNPRIINWPLRPTAGRSRCTVDRSMSDESIWNPANRMPPPRPRTPRPRTYVCGMPTTRLSRNHSCNRVSSESLGPAATRSPHTRPAKGMVSTIGRR